MEFGKQFTPSNSPPPPWYGQMWEGTTGVTPLHIPYALYWQINAIFHDKNKVT